METPPGADPVVDAPSFIVDVNAGKLAKWLRILGYDTLFVNPVDDAVLVDIARREGRIVLTRDTGIAARRVAATGEVRVLLVQGDRVEEQLRFVADRLGLRSPYRMFSRCLECNKPLRDVGREDVAVRVPPYVYRTQERYATCPGCGKIYWAGTHWQRMRLFAESMLEEGRSRG